MTNKKLLLAASIVLFVGSGLLFWGSNFAKTMIHDQLSEQKIVFNSKETLEKAGEKGEILKYAGQTVDTGTEARIYSEYIKGHLQKVAGGKTYSEVSTEYQKDTKNTTLSGQRTTLFMGETLRGLLLNAYGWGIVGMIAFYAGIAIFAAAIILLFVVIGMQNKKIAKRKTAKK
ncbi:MAG: hypothetical protein WCJ60_03700 [bacterium]